MAWTKRELDEALVVYERSLVQAGRTRGTITTYVGDVRRFIDWLAGAQQIPPPPALVALAGRWADAGRPPQPGIAWPRDRWTTAFPGHLSLLRALPDLLDRDAVRGVAGRASESEAASEAAFIATMVWGFGWVGYGPHRTANMLAIPWTPARLDAVAKTVIDAGAVAAYGRLAGDCRIRGLGPAFGTKFIAFCQRPAAVPVALIHDELVSAWLAANGRPDLGSAAWSPSTYKAYLEQIHGWAASVDLTPETVEYLIFQAMADARGNQWASGR
jgi:hypothetical protein